MAYEPTPIKKYKTIVSGKTEYEALPFVGNTPAGYTEVSDDEFSKFASEQQKTYARSTSPYTLENGVSIDIKYAQERDRVKNDPNMVNIGTAALPRYVPKGSAGLENYEKNIKGTAQDPASATYSRIPEPNAKPGGAEGVAGFTPPSAVSSETTGAPSGNAPVPGSTLFPRIPGATAPTAPVAPSEEDVRTAATTRAQATVNAINASFNRVISGEQEAGKGREARTRALNISAGLGGSDFASAAAIETEKGTQKNVAALEEERQNKVATILADVEERATQEFIQKKQLFNIDRQDYQQQLEAFQSKALESVAALAKSGVNLNALKTQEPETYKRLMEQTGKSELEVDSYFVSQIPQASIIDKVQVGNKYIILSKNPDGTIRKDTIDLPAEVIKDESTFTIAPDGTPLIFNKTTGVASIAKGFTSGQFAKPETKIDTDFTLSEGQVRYDATGKAIAAGPPKSKGDGTDAPTVKTFGQDNYAWNPKTNAWDPVALSDVSPQAKIDKAQDVIDILEDLGFGADGTFTAPAGFSGAVGAKGLSSFFGLKEEPIAGTAAASYKSKFQQLIGKLTLENMGIMKGVLSDADIKILKEASTALNTNIREEDFKKELGAIQTIMRKVVSKGGVMDPALGGGTVRLKDPSTGEVREFSNLSPADLQQALAAGYLQQ